MRARVHLNLAAAELASSGAVVGPLWVDTGGVAFPEVGWHDFPAPVMTWWIGELRAFIARSSNEAHLRFMDGPYELQLERIDQATTATFLRSGSGVLPAAEIDPEELLTSVLDRAMQLVSTFRDRGVVSSDLDDLFRVARRLD